MSAYFGYILHSKSADKFYVGQTSNLENRLLRHNHLSVNSYTSKYRPWQVVWVLEAPSLSAARNIENY